jgi:hypothetical protein
MRTFLKTYLEKSSASSVLSNTDQSICDANKTLCRLLSSFLADTEGFNKECSTFLRMISN